VGREDRLRVAAVGPALSPSPVFAWPERSFSPSRTQTCQKKGHPGQQRAGGERRAPPDRGCGRREVIPESLGRRPWGSRPLVFGGRSSDSARFPARVRHRRLLGALPLPFASGRRCAPPGAAQLPRSLVARPPGHGAAGCTPCRPWWRRSPPGSSAPVTAARQAGRRSRSPEQVAGAGHRVAAAHAARVEADDVEPAADLGLNRLIRPTTISTPESPGPPGPNTIEPTRAPESVAFRRATERAGRRWPPGVFCSAWGAFGQGDALPRRSDACAGPLPGV
jgi:hypothetical protein